MGGRRRLRAIATFVVAGGVLAGAGAAAPDVGPNPNGRIAFETDWVGEVPAVYRVDVTTGRSVLQTELEGGMTLVASPDRSTVLFVVARDPEQPSSPSIWRMNVDGSGKERLAFGSSPAWSPDGRRIAFVTAAGTVATATAGGGDVTSLAAGRAPTWSPDGRSLAYVADGASGSSVVVTGVDGTGARSTYDGAETATTLAWSPDGAHLAVSTLRALAIVPVAGGDVRIVATGGGHVTWSPDGSRVAFERSPTGISVVTMAGGAPVPLTVPPYPYDDLSPSWSPDGRELAFVRGMSAKHGFHAHELRVVSAEGGDSRVVATVRQLVSQPIWIGPSSLLLSQLWLHYPYRRGVFTVDPDGTERRPLARNGSEPAFSPDGRSIALVHWVDGQGGLFVMRADGRDLRRLTSSDGNDRSPSWSPDGSRIVFVRQSPGQDGALFTIRADGTQLTRIRAPRGVHSPAWSPDGRTIAAVRARDGALLVIAVTSGRARALTRAEGDATMSTQRPLWHPSGERLSFVRRTRCATVICGESRGELWSVGRRGGAPRRLLKDTYDAAWSPDGARLAVVGAAGRNLRLHTPGGRLLRTLVRSIFFSGGLGVSSVNWQPRCTLAGSSRANMLTAAARAELVCGLGGADRLAGGSGRDRLFGGDGDDVIEASGGGFDIVGCGAGRDRVSADVADFVGVDCERVTRR